MADWAKIIQTGQKLWGFIKGRLTPVNDPTPDDDDIDSGISDFIHRIGEKLNILAHMKKAAMEVVDHAEQRADALATKKIIEAEAAAKRVADHAADHLNRLIWRAVWGASIVLLVAAALGAGLMLLHAHTIAH